MLLSHHCSVGVEILKSLNGCYRTALFECVSLWDAEGFKRPSGRAVACERRLDQVRADENTEPDEMGRDVSGENHAKQHHDAGKQKNRSVEGHFSILPRFSRGHAPRQWGLALFGFFQLVDAHNFQGEAFVEGL